MKITCLSRYYLPSHNAGAEHMMHSVLSWLVSRGHSVSVVVEEGSDGSYILDDVEILVKPSEATTEALIASSDWVGSHLESAEKVFSLSSKFQKKTFHMMHFDSESQQHLFDYKNCDLMIFNSENMMKKGLRRDIPSMILYPQVWTTNYPQITDGEYITLININKNKGGELLPKIAKAMPEHKFLGVKGAYGDQVTVDVPNLTYWEHQEDINLVYQQTKILLVISKIETWGRVAIEACSAGIPVVYTSTPGLLESMGKAGVLVNRDSLKSITTGIKEVIKDPNKFIKKGLDRADKLETDGVEQLCALERYLLDSKNIVVEKDRDKALEIALKNEPILLAGKDYEQVLIHRDVNMPVERLEEIKTIVARPKVAIALKTFSHCQRRYYKGDVVIARESDLIKLVDRGFCGIHTNSN